MDMFLYEHKLFFLEWIPRSVIVWSHVHITCMWAHKKHAGPFSRRTHDFFPLSLPYFPSLLPPSLPLHLPFSPFLNSPPPPAMYESSGCSRFWSVFLVGGAVSFYFTVLVGVQWYSLPPAVSPKQPLLPVAAFVRPFTTATEKKNLKHTYSWPLCSTAGPRGHCFTCFYAWDAPGAEYIDWDHGQIAPSFQLVSLVPHFQGSSESYLLPD